MQVSGAILSSHWADPLDHKLVPQDTVQNADPYLYVMQEPFSGTEVPGAQLPSLMDDPFLYRLPYFRSCQLEWRSAHVGWNKFTSI
jgi:hypothetical protein